MNNLNPCETLFFQDLHLINDEEFLNLITKSYYTNPYDTIKTIFYIRDCRGGKGERRLGRLALKHILKIDPITFSKIIYFVPKYGRYDDLLELFVYSEILSKENEKYIPVSDQIITFYSKQLLNDFHLYSLGVHFDHYASKWAPNEKGSYDKKYGLCKKFRKKLHQLSKNHPNILIQHKLKNIKKPKGYRVFISTLRKYSKLNSLPILVKKNQSTNDINLILYNSVPEKSLHLYHKKIYHYLTSPPLNKPNENCYTTSCHKTNIMGSVMNNPRYSDISLYL